MIWRAWSFLSGIPLGVLALLALHPAAAAAELLGAGLGGGLLLVALTSALARACDGEPERGRHLAAASAAGWLALPALGAALLGLLPGPRGLLGATLILLAVALWRGARRTGAADGPARWVGRAALAVVFGAAAAVAAVGLVAALGAQEPSVSRERRVLIYDLDARVATHALPRCAARPLRVETLLERGAHPRLTSDGALIWFDAATADGTRQVHRLERSTGRVVCWTCGEPGNNLHPAPGGNGATVAFATDRHASWRHPVDREIHLAFAHGEQPRRPSRRLTFRPGVDDHPLFGPTSRHLVWSRGRGGRYEVVAATLITGHGGLLLGAPGLLASGGVAWIAPLAWSADARSLIVVRGNPFAPLAGFSLDPASGERIALGNDLARGASFTADGGWLAVATARRAAWAGRLPAGLGFLLAPWAERRGLRAPLLARSRVRTGPARGAPGAALELATLEDWGEPTGVALEPDGRGLVLGQRRRGPTGAVEERLVEVVLDCAASPEPTPERTPGEPAAAPEAG